MSILFSDAFITRHVTPKTDIYHEAHPLHHLILDEIEQWHEFMDHVDEQIYCDGNFPGFLDTEDKFGV